MVLYNQVALSCHEVPHLDDSAVLFSNDELVEWVELEDDLVTWNHGSVYSLVCKGCTYRNLNFSDSADYEGSAILDPELTIELGQHFLAGEILIEWESLTDVASILDNELRVFSCDFFKDLCCRKVALSWEHLLAFSVHDIAGLIDSV